MTPPPQQVGRLTLHRTPTEFRARLRDGFLHRLITGEGKRFPAPRLARLMQPADPSLASTNLPKKLKTAFRFHRPM